MVWIYSPEDDKANQACESTLFQNEQIVLARKMFRTYRVDVTTIRNDKIREEYEKSTPSFHFFDPKGAQVARLAGRKATSLSSFTTLMEKTWGTSFKTRLKTYARSMTKLLDRLDKIEARKLILEREKLRLTEKPNPRKQRAVAADEKKLDEMISSFNEDEQKLTESVLLRPEYLPRAEAPEND